MNRCEPLLSYRLWNPRNRGEDRDEMRSDGIAAKSEATDLSHQSQYARGQQLVPAKGSLMNVISGYELHTPNLLDG